MEHLMAMIGASPTADPAGRPAHHGLGVESR